MTIVMLFCFEKYNQISPMFDYRGTTPATKSRYLQDVVRAATRVDQRLKANVTRHLNPALKLSNKIISSFPHNSCFFSDVRRTETVQISRV